MLSYPLVTVGALIVSPAKRILIIKTHKWKDSWGVPGGKIDYGESIKAALIREFKEETKLSIKDIHWAPTLEAINSSEFYKPAHFILLNFIAKSDTEEVELNEEAQTYLWLNPEEALTYPLNEPTRKLVTYYQANPFTTARLE